MKHIKKFEGFDDNGLGTLSGMDHPGSLRGWEKANDNPYEGYYIIGWGLSGGFGGIQNYEVIIADSEEDAESQAYQNAIEEYQNYDGMHGLRSISDIMEEDGIDDEEEAESIYNEEREDWLDYSAKPYSKEYEKEVKDYHYHNRYSDKMN